MHRFPALAARNLDGEAVDLPAGFTGERNLVLVAFRRDQQAAVDSWIAWHEALVAGHPGWRAYEVPVIATRWSPGRAMIDGGMAKAVATGEARRRTLTVYSDVRRVTDGLAIRDTSEITVLLVDDTGAHRVAHDGRVDAGVRRRAPAHARRGPRSSPRYTT